MTWKPSPDDLIAARKTQIAQVLPREIKPERFAHIALNAVRTTPRLVDCTADSFLGGLIQSSILGLEPNTVMGHAYLIPFWNSRKSAYEAQFIPGYRGLVELARRSGSLRTIAANVVREGDVFEYEYGIEERLRHVPANAFDPDAEMLFAYAYAKLDGGFCQFVVMRAGEVLAIRNNSPGWKHAVKMAKKYNRDPDSPWHTHPDQMWAKTAIRRLYKFLPASHEMRQVEALDAMADAGSSQGLERTLDGEVVDFSSEPGDSYSSEENAPENGGEGVQTPTEIKSDAPDTVDGVKLSDDQARQLREWGFFESPVESEDPEKDGHVDLIVACEVHRARLHGDDLGRGVHRPQVLDQLVLHLVVAQGER